MSITAALILFSVTWFLVLFVLLPVRLQSQAEAGHIVPGTPGSAPADPMLGRKMKWTTLIATLITLALYVIITSGVITLRDIDFRGSLGPAPTDGG